MILVAGGTGRLGSELVRRLVAQRESVRVLTRDPARAAHLPGVEVVVGDVRHPVWRPNWGPVPAIRAISRPPYCGP